MGGIGPWKDRMIAPERALPGRATPMAIDNVHFVIGGPLRDAFAGYGDARFGMGCFWGAERMFWSMPGVVSTAPGYAGGYTPNPTYREVCSGETGHAEIVRVIFDPSIIGYGALLQAFWENHDPTQGMRQGGDVGTQYRSMIQCTTQAQYALALASRDDYQKRLTAAGLGQITTEIVFPAPEFYYAENEHQQYLAKNPDGYCGLGGTGVSCPVGTGA